MGSATKKCPYCGAGWAGRQVSSRHVSACAKKNKAALSPSAGPGRPSAPPAAGAPSAGGAPETDYASAYERFKNQTPLSPAPGNRKHPTVEEVSGTAGTQEPPIPADAAEEASGTVPLPPGLSIPVDAAGNRRYKTPAGWMSEAEVQEKYGKDAYLAPTGPRPNRNQIGPGNPARVGRLSRKTQGEPNSLAVVGRMHRVKRRRGTFTRLVEGTKSIPKWIEDQEDTGWEVGAPGSPRLYTGRDETIV